MQRVLLTDRDRSRITCHHARGISTAQIATWYGVSTDTIRRVLREQGAVVRRGRQGLRQSAAPYLPTQDEIETAKVEIHRRRAERMEAAERGYRVGGMHEYKGEVAYTVPEIRVVTPFRPLVR